MKGGLGPVIDQAPYNQGMNQMNVYDDALRYVNGRGITSPTISKMFDGLMPANLSSLTDQQIGDLLNDLNVRIGYLDVELAHTDAKQESAEKALEFTKATVRLAVGDKDESGKKLTGPDKNDRVMVDSRVLDAMNKYLFAYSVYKITKAVRDQAQGSWDTVSRNITQRGQEVDRQRRGDSVGHIPAPQFRTPQRG